MQGFVEALWMVDLLAGRASAAMTDFILAGPVARYLAGMAGGAPRGPFVLVTSREYSGRLVDAVRLGARPLGGVSYVGLSGLAWSGILYGWRVDVLEDPVVEVGGRRLSFTARELARVAPVAVVNGRPVRLATRELDEALSRVGLY